jgi:hypothetical protein
MNSLRKLVAEELGQPVDPRVTALAAAIAKHQGQASRAVLFYGSCLRQNELDGLMLDFYLIVSDYRAAYSRHWLALANRLVPPNVFYFEHDGLRAKYAVLSEADFYRLNGPETRSVTVWARFAQPSRLVWAANAAARTTAIDAVARAAPTLFAAAGQRRGEDELDPWRRAFSLTYSAELRAERKDRSCSIVDEDRDRYRRFTGPALAAMPSSRPGASWRRRRLEGKALSVLRLAKANRLEDQPARGHANSAQGLAAALAAARRDQPFAATPEVRSGSIGSRARAAATASASAATVNGLRSSS